jgi:CheY-like chemotaxis protein
MAGTGRGERILLVDDDPAIVLIVERLLSLAGYQVRAFEDPVLALAALGEQPDGVDLVLSDFNMPGLSGVELARQCLALRPNLPVVISSGYLSEDVRQAALAVGVRELLQKEFSVEQLPELLRRVLDTR